MEKFFLKVKFKGWTSQNLPKLRVILHPYIIAFGDFTPYITAFSDSIPLSLPLVILHPYIIAFWWFYTPISLPLVILHPISLPLVILHPLPSGNSTPQPQPHP